MKKISVLKLGNLDKKCLEEKEMDRLVGGNYSAGTTANQVANTYAGKCSCMCEGSGVYSYYNTINSEAHLYKSNGTIVK